MSVVIPALEEPYLDRLVESLREYEVKVQGELGLGIAVWNGIRTSKNSIIVVMDADGSHPPEAIPPMLKMLDEKTRLVVGSRYCRGGYSCDSPMRKIVSLTYCLLARLVLKTSIHDVMSGFWVGYKSAFKFKPTRSFKFGLQLLRNNRGFVKEYPILFRRRRAGKSHVKPLQALLDFLAILIPHWEYRK